jgi:hypothetical protein
MIRRWLIRSVALTLLTLCVVAWVGSDWRRVRIDYRRTLWQTVEVMSGKIGYFQTTSTRSFVGWRLTIGPAGPMEWDGWNSVAAYPGLGFHVAPNKKGWAILAPLWLPSLLCAVLLWLVWRKTRPKYNGKGFPVEPTPKAEVK